MENIIFTKMHGLGNDFVIIDSREKEFELNAEQIAKLCDRKFGVGCDQLVIITESTKYDCGIIFYNSDGSKSGACGNASRCVAKIIMDEKKSNIAAIEASDRILECSLIEADIISINMGDYTTSPSSIPIDRNIDPLSLPKVANFQEGIAIGVGNPHAIYFVDNLYEINHLDDEVLDEINSFFPEGVNISLVEIVNDSEIKQKVWERGAGLTLACGTGACAATAACVICNKTKNSIKVNQPGGQLQVSINNKNVTMSGKVSKVFTGHYCGNIS